MLVSGSSNAAHLNCFLPHIGMVKAADMTLGIRSFASDFKIADEKHFFELRKKLFFSNLANQFFAVDGEKSDNYLQSR